MSTQLQTIGNFSIEEMETMQQTLAVGATPAQFGLFVRTAAASGLNPFLNHIYCIVYGGKMSIQVSVEGIVFLAKRVDGYEGIDTQLVHENDEFEAHIDPDGKWVIGEHAIKFPRGKVLACYSIAYRTGFKPYTVFIEADEVQHHLAGINAGNWKKYYNDFFKKTATKRAAKGQFGIEISEDEAPTSTNDPSQGYERKEINLDAEPTTKPETKSTAAGKTKADAPKTIDAEIVDEATQVTEINAATKTGLTALGIVEKEARGAYMKEHMPMAGATPTLEERKTFLIFVEAEIAKKQAAFNDDLPE